jgi:hypothetical protein
MIVKNPDTEKIYHIWHYCHICGKLIQGGFAKITELLPNGYKVRLI